MRSFFGVSLSMSLLFGLAAATACTSSSNGSSGGSSGSSGSCNDYSPPSSFDATTPAVSFAKDVIPIFQASCAFSTCHGATTGTANGVFLGSDAPRVYKGLFGMAGNELPAMPFVTAGDPRQSYVMRKLDGSQCALDAQCTGGSCMASMPMSAGTLDLPTRDTVRRWIAQGAKDD